MPGLYNKYTYCVQNACKQSITSTIIIYKILKNAQCYRINQIAIAKTHFNKLIFDPQNLSTVLTCQLF